MRVVKVDGVVLVCGFMVCLVFEVWGFIVFCFFECIK